MFNFVEKHKRLIMFLMVLVIAPAFVIVGVDTFQRGADAAQIAEVGGNPITVEEYERNLEQQRERLRQTLGRNFDASLFDTPAMRKEVLDRMIADRVLSYYAARNHLDRSVSPAQINAVLRQVPGLADPDGQISKENLTRLSRSVNMSPDGLLASVRADLAEQQIARAIEQGAFVSKNATARFVQSRGETREVSRFFLPAGQYASKVDVKPEEIENYYKAHNDDFRTPEQLRAEYVVLSKEAIESQIVVNPDEVQRQYESATGTNRKARQEARAKAESVLAELRKDPQKFPELAKQHSQDPVSAAQGGDLDYFTRGSMVKPFEDAVFKLKPKEISPIVETDFGFHIIQLTDIRKGPEGEERRASHILLGAPASPKEVASKTEIERSLRQQQVTKKFAEEVENFKDVAFDQPDSLQPLADRFKLKVQTSNWLSRTTGQPPLDNQRLLNALFTDDALKDKRNSEAVEVAPGRWIVARVVEHRPASIRPLEQVRTEIEGNLREEKAIAMAKQIGEEKLKALQSGGQAEVKWSAPTQITRDRAAELNRDMVNALFKADTQKLPAYVGMEVPRAGYALLRITKVERPEKISDEQLKSASYALNQVTALQQRQAFVNVLRERADVEVNEARLEKKADDAQQ